MKAKTTMAVATIKNGTVIDHIPQGQALAIIQLLKIGSHHKQVTLGLNLPSASMGSKDILKVEDRVITPEEANQIALFSPNATISIIQDYEVIKKYKVALPDTISNVVRCPNPQCISNHENMACSFIVKPHHDMVSLHCKFCRKSFSQHQIRESILNTTSLLVG